MREPGGSVHQHDENEKGKGEQTRGKARLNFCGKAQAGGYEAGAHEVGPKKMPGNEFRDHRGDFRRDGEVFGAEGGDRSGVEDGAEEDKPVESASFLPVAGEKNDGETDDKNDPKDEIRPDDGWKQEARS